MKKVYFVRHGETVGNVAGYSQLPETELSDGGHAGAAALAERLAHITIDELIASPYVRAQQTAGYISEKLALQIETYDEIHEILRPSAIRGKIVDDEIALIYDQYDKEYWNKNSSMEGMENVFSVQQRVKKTLSFIESKSAENILIVSHGEFIRNLITYVLVGEVGSWDSYQAVYDGFVRMSNVAINEIVLKEGGWNVVSYNDHSHFNH